MRCVTSSCRAPSARARTRQSSRTSRAAGEPMDHEHDPTTMTTLLELLRQGAAEHLAPPQMLSRLAALRARHPALAAELVWEREPHLGTYHYDALVDDPGGTVSLAFCPDDA